MQYINRDQLYDDGEYRFTYVSGFMDFGKLYNKHTSTATLTHKP